MWNWKDDSGKIGALGAGVGYLLGSRSSDAPGEGVKLGYQGEIPDYSLVREQVLDAHDPSMPPGARGKRYFSDFRYMPMGNESALAGIAGVRQDLFDQANVGPDSLRARNYARQGVSDRLPDLGDRGPTGINTVVGAPFDYSQRGLAREEARTYTMADVDDPSKTQYFRDGTVYIPDYGFVNVSDAASIAGLTHYLAPAFEPQEAPPAAGGEPPAGEEPSAADLIANGAATIDDPTGRAFTAADQQALVAAGYTWDSTTGVWTLGTGTTTDPAADPEGKAQGGLVSLMGGGYLSGATDGMADRLNTTIDNTQPAALSDGEFVVAADVVSHLGNGNSGAGAEQLYAMMDEIRMDRTGTKNQGRQINPNQYMPRGVA